MFGYVNVNKDDLSEKDRQIYQSYYCGLCHELNKLGGKKAQILLNYDMTFLIVLLAGLYELEDEVSEFMCPLHPAGKKIRRINDATEYAADMNILLSYQNFADDYKDGGTKHGKLMMALLRKDYERIFSRYPRQGKALEKAMKELWAAEERNEENIDLVAGITGEMLAEIFAWDDRMWADDLRTLGFYMGKFIYIMDAYEDIDKDVRKGDYNVLEKTYRSDRREFDAFSNMLLTSMMSECAKTFERMPVIHNASILRNILYSGVWTRFEITRMKRQRSEEKKMNAKRKRMVKMSDSAGKKVIRKGTQKTKAKRNSDKKSL